MVELCALNVTEKQIHMAGKNIKKKNALLIKNILENGSIGEKKSLFLFDINCSNESILFRFGIWSRYFFPQYFKSEDAPFHKEMNLYNIQLYKGELDSFVNIAFRGAGKDVKTQLFIAFAILNDTGSFRKYFKVLSDDATNAVQSVTDIYNMFVNPKITAMYPDTFEKTVFKREERKDTFTTSKGIKVLADIVGTSQRGAKQEEARPDFIWANDFETRRTLRSAVISNAIASNMEEARTGLEKGGAMLYTCNYISEAGNVHRLVTEKQSPRKKIFIVPIIKDGVPTWNRYTLADIEEMRKTDEDFEGERLCKPSASKDMYFDREKLDAMKPLQPIRDIAGFKMFKEYNRLHRYGGGHDVAGGVGLDSSTSVFIDFDTIPAQVVATFASNTVLPEAFGDEVYSQGNRYGGCILGIENNKYDQAILKAKQLGAKLYMTATGKTTTTNYSLPSIYGWSTNSLTKSKMLADMREAIESGLIELNDQDLINELKSYTRNDLIDNAPDIRLTTRHFDLLTALCIAWQMKDHARKKKEREIINEKEETNIAI
jgi:hypothetical protein